MGRIIEFHIPARFRRKETSTPQSHKGKLIESARRPGTPLNALGRRLIFLKNTLFGVFTSHSPAASGQSRRARAEINS
jgi:hypothetical protein